MTVLTLHILTSVPWSNLNRDDTGTPKRTRQGGVQRALLSSQSLKRAARTAFENATLEEGFANRSVRSANLASVVAARALELDPELTEKKARAAAAKLIGQLTKSDKNGATAEPAKGDDDGDGTSADGRSAWLSAEEIETAAKKVVDGSEGKDFVDPGRTGSLAIAAFGRMFAAASELKTEAAIAVSPAVTTHEAEIEIDYFSTVDDSQTAEAGSGASFLGLAQYTSGVFYRSVTIDREELRRAWTGMSSENARELLTLMVGALVRSLPRGKKNSTAPYTMPILVMAEEQRYRTAYDFETPVQPGADQDGTTGGFAKSSVEQLGAQRAAALRFDPANFVGPARVSGTAEPEVLATVAGEVEVSDLPALVDSVVDWILA